MLGAQESQLFQLLDRSGVRVSLCEGRARPAQVHRWAGQAQTRLHPRLEYLEWKQNSRQTNCFNT